MPLEIVRNDIRKMTVEAIVFTILLKPALDL